MENKNNEIHHQTNFDEKAKHFFKDKKNITITILTIVILILLGTYPSKSTDILPVSTEDTTNLSSQLTEANQKVQTLESTNQTLVKEKEELTAKLNSMASVEELQKTIEEKSNYIFNLEAQVGSLTADKAQLETQNGILQGQLEEAKSKVATSSATTTAPKSTNSNTDTSATVYVTKTGDKYHRSSCSYLRSSKISISKNSAISQGYTPCSRCNP